MRLATLMSLILLAACFSQDARPQFETDEATQPTTYRYRLPNGRWAFTGSLDSVPPDLRDSAEPMDLSHVSLNIELGNEIRDAIAEEHRQLSSSSGCVMATIEADQDTFERMLVHHQPTMGIALVALILILTAPMAIRHFGAPEWSRVLMFVLPILGLLGALTFGIGEARKGLAHAREGADLCDPERFAAAPLQERQERLRRLDEFLAREGAVHTATD